MPKLGVNIDHVATLRQARRTFEPDPVFAAVVVTLAGADVITVHLREDRRHINDRDLRLIKEVVPIKLNLEMAIAKEIVDIALDVLPQQATLVPEKREEITTEGGLDAAGGKSKISETVKKLKDKGIIVSLFIDPEEKQIKAARDTGASFIELHTGRYANATRDEEKARELNTLSKGVRFAKSLGLRVNAGHGLTYYNVSAIADIEAIEELHIGHSIISRAVIIGLSRAVREMKELIKQ